MLRPWLDMALVLGALGGALGGLRVYQRRRGPRPEMVRKLFHVAGGLLALSLPVVFDRVWPVAVLGGAVTLGLLALRCRPSLRDGLGRVLSSVERDSLGDLCFPVGVTLLFALANDDPLRYAIPILALALADPAAALAGERWGVHRYPSLGGEKSVEGSGVFFVVTFVSCQLPLLLLKERSVSSAVFISAVVAFVLTLVEAAAGSGLDNILIPLAGFALLQGLPGLAIGGRP